jgi:hypothetical protein
MNCTEAKDHAGAIEAVKTGGFDCAVYPSTSMQFPPGDYCLTTEVICRVELWPKLASSWNASAMANDDPTLSFGWRMGLQAYNCGALGIDEIQAIEKSLIEQDAPPLIARDLADLAAL